MFFFEPEDLFSLLDDLRLQLGFNIGVEQYIAAQDLILALTSQGKLPESHNDYKSLLAPIICKSPKEQEDFYSYFDNWIKTYSLTKSLNQIEEKELTKEFFPKEIKRKKYQWWFIIPSIFLVLSLITIKYFWQTYPPKFSTIHGKVVNSNNEPVADATIYFLDKDTKSDSVGHFSLTYQPKDSIATITAEHPAYPIATAKEISLNGSVDSVIITLHRDETKYSPDIQKVEEDEELTNLVYRINAFSRQYDSKAKKTSWKLFYNRHFKNIRLIGFILPLIIVTIWWLWRYFRNRVLLRRMRSLKRPEIEEILLKHPSYYLGESNVFRRIAQGMKKLRSVKSDDLNIEFTVNETAKRAGLFSPVYDYRAITPEYLVLIDQISINDQQTEFVEGIISKIKATGIYVEQYYFNGEAYLCYSKEPNMLHLNLTELYAKFPDHRLIIFSDAKDFFSPVNGKPKPWLEKFLLWKERFIFTPSSPESWGYKESLLNGMDLIILPLTKEGLEKLVNTLQSGTKPEYIVNLPLYSKFPVLLKEWSDRWFERQPPETEIREKLIKQLKRYLDVDGFLWLAACAAYPEIKWELILHFGNQLKNNKGKSILTEELILKIIRLPWLRHGKMPDWFRLLLLNDISSEQRREIQKILNDLLDEVAQKIEHGFSIELSQKTINLAQTLVLKFKHVFSLQKLQFDQLDYVFLCFNKRKKLNKLAPSVPNQFRRLLFKRGIKPLGMHTFPAYAMALILSFLIWFKLPQFSQPSKKYSPIPSFNIANESNPINARIAQFSFAYSDSSWNYYAQNISADSFNLDRNENWYYNWLKDTLEQAIGFDTIKFSFYSSIILPSASDHIKNLGLEPIYLLRKSEWLTLSTSKSYFSTSENLGMISSIEKHIFYQDLFDEHLINIDRDLQNIIFIIEYGEKARSESKDAISEDLKIKNYDCYLEYYFSDNESEKYYSPAIIKYDSSNIEIPAMGLIKYNWIYSIRFGLRKIPYDSTKSTRLFCRIVREVKRKEDTIDTQIPLASGSFISYEYEETFQDSLLDKLHGYHKFAEYLSNPFQLSSFLKQHGRNLNEVQNFIRILDSRTSNGTKMNVIAIFGEAYWNLVNKLLMDEHNYERVDNIKRRVKLPLNRVRIEIFKGLIEDYLYIPQITLMIDYENTINQVEIAKLGSRDNLLVYIKTGLENELQKYIAPPRSDYCSNFPFEEIQTDIEKAFESFKNTGITFDEFKEYMYQYCLTPELITEKEEIPMLKISFSTIMSARNIIELPIPITMLSKSRELVYVQNAARAAIGNLLRSGINRELILIIKLAHNSHRQLFEQCFNEIKVNLEREKDFELAHNAEVRVSNSNTLFYRIQLIPSHSNCESIKAVNNGIEKSRDIITDFLNKDIEIKYFNYTLTDFGGQVFVVQPKID